MVLLVPGNKISVVLETVATEGEVMSNCDNQEGREFDLTSTGKEAIGEWNGGTQTYVHCFGKHTSVSLHISVLCVTPTDSVLD